MIRKYGLTILVLLAAPVGATAQMTVEEYTPRSTLKVPEHKVTRAKFPFIDIHNHQPTQMPPERLSELVREMDKLNMKVMVNLTGRQGAPLKTGIDNIKATAPKRFVMFANLDFTGIDQPGWTERAVKQFEQDVRNGARGLKIFKNLGMEVEDSKGRVRTNDPRLDPIWAKAGELGVPVLIHTAEPSEFFAPWDNRNERWLELKEYPSRKRPADPSWETLMAEQWDIIRRHRNTNFISAHLSWLGGDLPRLGKLMDEMPNYYTELGAVLAELGRQPRFAKQWLIKYQDRVLMGKDTWAPEEYYVYFRVLETEDEYFDYYRRRHAFWKMYGLGLPDDVLKKIYYKNALRIVPGLDASAFPQ